MDKRIDLLIQLLDQAYDRKAWHGTNLRGSMRGISRTDALWRPGPSRHNIWEIVLHAAYWKFCVRRHITGEKSLRFELRGSNWFAVKANSTEADWKAALKLLGREHAELRAALRAFPPSRLSASPPKLKWRYEQYIYGAASHDLYHAGQIQLLKRLHRSRG